MSQKPPISAALAPSLEDRSRSAPSWGSLEQGIAYLLTLSLSDALLEEEKEALKTEKRALLEEMSLAGLKGSRQKRADATAALEALFFEGLDPLLNKERGTSNLLEQKQHLEALFTPSSELYPLALNLKKNHLHLLFRWQGERALAAAIAEWKESLPQYNWAAEDSILQVEEKKMSSFISFLEKEGALVTSLLQQEVKEQQEDNKAPLSFSHISVLLSESIQALAPAPGKLIVDATLGGGGHTEALLQAGASVIGIDQDPEARLATAQRLASYGDRFQIVAGNFRDISSLLAQIGVTQVDGILADIGVSSHQLDTPERGFSFRDNGPLDMRMSPTLPRSAADIVNFAPEEELARLIWQYGEEKASRNLAKALVAARAKAPFETTHQLAQFIEKIIPRRGAHHPGTKTFQALRIAVNDELGALEELLEASCALLRPEGRLALITFHSLEDRIVKQFLDTHSKKQIDRPEWPEARPNPACYFEPLHKKPLTASPEELKANPRSRSAKLRSALRNSNPYLPPAL